MKTTLIPHKKFQYIITIIVLSCLLTFSASAQTWQWGRRGGGALGTSSNNKPESVYSIVTDSQKNVYTLSYLGEVNCNEIGRAHV